MADAPASLEAIYGVARAFDGASVPYAFIGGIALSVWAIPRATFDIDVAVSAGTSNSDVLSLLEQRGATVDSAFASGFRDTIAGMPKLHVHLPIGRSLLAVDVFFAETRFLQSVIERRVSTELGAGPIFVCTAADLVIFKLLADRAKDRIDARNVVLVQGVPERPYLERWASELGIRARLEALLADTTR